MIACGAGVRSRPRLNADPRSADTSTHGAVAMGRPFGEVDDASDPDNGLLRGRMPHAGRHRRPRNSARLLLRWGPVAIRFGPRGLVVNAFDEAGYGASSLAGKRRKTPRRNQQ